MTSVFTDNFYHTFSGEVYTESQCLIHEHSTAQLFYSMLINLGYRSTDANRRVWKNNEKVVVVCLSDDFTFSQTVKSRSLDNCFDADTVVITDNYTYFNPQYTVLRVPDSYFGIFHYVPSLTEFRPVKRFNFSVNRIDRTRELILLELINQSGGVESWLRLDHANFNCFDPDSANQSVDNIKTNFLKFWPASKQIDPAYKLIVQDLIDHLPVRTHQMSVEQVHLSAYLNLVVESYNNDTVVALSEKTFRALATPAPWTLFGSIGTIDRLIELGFDVMPDIIDHSYNTLTQPDSFNRFNGIKKIRTYIDSSIGIYKKLVVMDVQHLKTRCEQAAEHNQQHLANLQKQWPQDFANWLPTAISKIAGK